MLDYSNVETFETAGGQAFSEGTGLVILSIKDTYTQKLFQLNLHGVAYIPEAPMNLISIGLLEEKGFYLNNRKRIIENGKQSINIVKLGNLYKIDARALTQNTVQNTNQTKQQIQTVDKSDWKLLPSYFNKLNAKYGPFQIELFKNSTNNLLPVPSGSPKDSFDMLWAGQTIYGNPVYINKFIYKTLEKATTDFKQNPENTVFVFVVPKWETSHWWKDLVKYFDIVEEYPKGTKLFTIPLRQHFIPTKTDMSPDGRVVIEGVDWPVVVLYKDVHTATKVDTKLLAHLRFGHYSSQKLQQLHATGTPLGLKLSAFDRHVLNCDACNAAKAIRPSFPASDQGTVSNLKSLIDGYR